MGTNIGGNIIAAFEAGRKAKLDKQQSAQQDEERKLRLKQLKMQMDALKHEGEVKDFESRYGLATKNPGTEELPMVPGNPGAGSASVPVPNAAIASPFGGMVTPPTQNETDMRSITMEREKQKIAQQFKPPQEPYASSPQGIYNKVTGEVAQPAAAPSMTPYQEQSLALQRQRVDQSGQPSQMSPYQRESLDLQRERMQQPNISPRDVATAKSKLLMVQIAKNQLAKLRQTFQAVKGTQSAGLLQGIIPTEKGQAYDAAVDAMRSVISGLTRTPGIGSMSDFETRLANAAVPARSAMKFESTLEEQINNLDSLLNGLEGGYQGMLAPQSGQQQPTQGTVSPRPPGVPADAVWDEASQNWVK